MSQPAWFPGEESFKALYGIHSASVIAAQLGTTRNAVLGKALRLGLPSRVRFGRPAQTNSTAMPAARRGHHTPPFTPPARPAVHAIAPCAATLSTKPCRWPHGDPGHPGFHFCESPAVLGRSYCPAHMAVAYAGWRP